MAKFEFIFILIIVAAAIVEAQTDFDCSQSPPNPQSVKNCCRRSAFNLKKFKNQCFNSTTVVGRDPNRQAHMNPCVVDCVLTAGGALSNETFVLPKLKEVLQEVIQNDTVAVNILFEGFKICIPEVTKKIQEFQKGQPKNFPKSLVPCTPFAMVTTLCAIRHMFINCPKSMWTNTDVCNNAQEFVKNCAPLQFGGTRIRTG